MSNLQWFAGKKHYRFGPHALTDVDIKKAGQIAANSEMTSYTVTASSRVIATATFNVDALNEKEALIAARERLGQGEAVCFVVDDVNRQADEDGAIIERIELSKPLPIEVKL